MERDGLRQTELCPRNPMMVYAPTSDHDDNEVDHFYQRLQEIIDQTPKKDILVVQGDWNAKVRKEVCTGRLGRSL